MPWRHWCGLRWRYPILKVASRMNTILVQQVNPFKLRLIRLFVTFNKWDVTSLEFWAVLFFTWDSPVFILLFTIKVRSVPVSPTRCVYVTVLIHVLCQKWTQLHSFEGEIWFINFGQYQTKTTTVFDCVNQAENFPIFFSSFLLVPVSIWI